MKKEEVFLYIYSEAKHNFFIVALGYNLQFTISFAVKFYL